MRFSICLFAFLINYIATYGQINNDYSTLLHEAEQIVFSAPNESIKIASHLSESSLSTVEKIQANHILFTAHYIKGDYNSAAHFIFEAKKLSDASENVNMQIKTAVYSLPLLYHLGLNIVAHEYIGRLNKLPKKSETDHWLKIANVLIDAFDAADREQHDQAIAQFQKVNAYLRKSDDPILLPIVAMREFELNFKARQLTKRSLDDAPYLNSANPLHHMAAEQLMGKYQFLSKDYSSSILHYNAALAIAKNLGNRFYRAQIEDGLAKSYLGIDSKVQFQTHKKAALQLYDEAEAEEKNTINSIFNYIYSNQTNQQQDLVSKYQNNLLILAGLLVAILMSYFAFRWRYKAKALQYEEFFNYFEKRQQPEEEPKKELAKSSTMPKETEALLLKRLNQFENSKQFNKPDMSLALLAASFDSNTKYLSEIINTYKGKNFNAYINELRINYIIDKLQNNKLYRQYKISYLAEECGFSSHSSFGSVFKSVTGISPTVFIEILETHIKNVKTANVPYEPIS